MRISCYSLETHSEVPADEISKRLHHKKEVIWVDITLPSESGIDLMRNTFRFHELSIEDVLNQEQRPKAEEFPDHLFIILNPLDYRHGKVYPRELDVFVGHNYMVTVHTSREPLIAEAQKRIGPDRVQFAVSTTYLLYVLLDTIVDGYLPILEKIENEIDSLGTRLMERPTKAMQRRLFELKENLNAFWWIVWPQKDILNILNNHDLIFIEGKSQYYLRDVDDHLQRITNIVQASRESITGLINLYLSAVSNQLNLAVNRLTIITLMSSALAVIGGFYGMNFEQTWPPFDAPWGVAFVIALMITVCLTIFLLVRRRD
ncbi:MAG: magnesium/cobalt transporter CorA [Anaerolineae bacterium]